MYRVKSTGHGFDWKIERLNLLIGACHLLRCCCVGQLKTFDASSWTGGPNFFQVFIFIHTLCILVTKANASLHMLASVFFGQNATRTPKHMCWPNIAWTTRDICVQFSFILSRRLGTGAPDHWARTPNIENCAYSIKYLNNFLNALPTDFKLLHIKAMVFSVLSKVSINFRI